MAGVSQDEGALSDPRHIFLRGECRSKDFIG